jgi:hypothetical protein
MVPAIKPPNNPAPNPSPAKACFGVLIADAIVTIAMRHETKRRRIEPSNWTCSERR